MNADFFALAFVAALNTKLLALDLLLIENKRPRAMFLSILLGGMTVALTFGLVDVLAVRADALTSQRHFGAGVDLALGLLLILAGVLLATGRLHGRRREQVPVPSPASGGPSGPASGVSSGPAPGVSSGPAPGPPAKKDSWAARVLAEPRLGLAVAVGVLVGLPGASYLDALHHLITGRYATATLVIAVVVFVIIEFLLILVPFAFLELRPAATKAALKQTHDWLLRHALHVMAAAALALGAYLTISGLIRL